MAGPDIVLINPGDRKQVFQGLAAELMAVEPPFWVAVLAAYLRNRGFDVSIIDANAENISPAEVAERVNALDPLLAAVIVYGSQPSASTQNMTISQRICRALKEGTGAKVAIGGLHPSALPRRTLEESGADFVIEGEGPYTLEGLLHSLRDGAKGLAEIPGLWRFENGKPVAGPKAPLLDNLDTALPVAAWDLLPMRLYRAHNWHCFDDIKHKTGYAAIYTSLGCPFHCVFCCINAPFGKPGIRFRGPETVLAELGLLVEKYGVKNIKIVDELFILNEKHYMAIVDGIIERGYPLNIWAYARVDTVKPGNLARMKKAGINWVALGIESANADVRDGAAKKMQAPDIKAVVRAIQEAGIRVIGNYIFGLPDDTLDTMRQTLDMAMDLNCEFANFYSAMAYPGSELYGIALQNGWPLPDRWHGFSQHAYETLPLPTKYLSAAQVLKFRDDAFHAYFENPAYLRMVREKFGPEVEEHIHEMTKVRLKRKLLGD